MKGGACAGRVIGYEQCVAQIVQASLSFTVSDEEIFNIFTHQIEHLEQKLQIGLEELYNRHFDDHTCFFQIK